MKKLRPWLFGAGALLIVAAVGWNMARSEIALRYGTLHRMKIRGFDPHDPFRGRYLAFTMPADVKKSEISHDRGDFSAGTVAYVTLKRGEDGFSSFETLLAEPPAEGDYLKVSCASRWSSNGFVAPFSRFYLNEALAPEAEKLLDRALRDDKNPPEILFRVHRGHGALADLQIGGRSIVELARESRGR